MNLKKHIPLVSLALVFAITTLVFHGSVLDQWSNGLMGEGEDGAKNFYTLAYQIEHSETFIWFDGMNYPFGEHVMYTDNQPLLASILKILNLALPISNNLTFLFPFIFLLSFLFGALLLFKLLQAAGGPNWFNVLASVGIIFLSPQWIRLGGHYSLAHGFVIPLVLFALWKFTTDKSVIWLILAPVIAGFLHPYFLVMTSLFIGVFLLINQLAQGQTKTKRSWVLVVLIPMIPILFFQAFMLLTDPVIGRPDAPFGYLIYKATWSSVFVPLSLPYGHFFTDIFESSMESSAEGSFYVGGFSILISAIGLIGLIFSSKLRENKALKFAFIAFLASIPVLLLSLGWPFTFYRFEYLLDYVGPLRQFRGIGRFSFMFFYAINLFAAMYLATRLKNKSAVSVILTSAALLILFIEAGLFSRYINQSTSSGSDQFSQNHWDNAILQGFDAIVPIPFYHTGSENFRTPETLQIIESSMALSQATGTPLLSVQLSRTSLAQTLQTKALLGEQLALSSIANQHSSEHWLVMVDTRHPLKPEHQKIIDKSQPIVQMDEFDFYDLPVFAFQTILTENQEEALALKDSCFNADALNKALMTHDIYYESFDQTGNENIMTFKGKGSSKIERIDWTPLIPKTTLNRVQHDYELSFWIYAADQHAVNSQIWFWEKDNGTDLAFNVTEVGDHVTAIKGDWALVSYTFTPHSDGSFFEILLHRDGPSMPITIDEILLRPINQNVYKTGSLNLNNRYFQPIDSSVVNE